jgi:hypothetical protein
VTVEEARKVQPGTHVRETEYDLHGRFVRLCDSEGDLYAEVDHDYDGGGFDFWPVASLEVIHD